MARAEDAAHQQQVFEPAGAGQRATSPKRRRPSEESDLYPYPYPYPYSHP